MGQPRVLLADDHTMVVEAFRKLLELEFEIVGTVGDGRTLVTTAPGLKPDVIVIDISMNGDKQIRTFPICDGRSRFERNESVVLTRVHNLGAQPLVEHSAEPSRDL